jgi:hypothetical protein
MYILYNIPQEISNIKHNTGIKEDIWDPVGEILEKNTSESCSEPN